MYVEVAGFTHKFFLEIESIHIQMKMLEKFCNSTYGTPKKFNRGPKEPPTRITEPTRFIGRFLKSAAVGKSGRKSLLITFREVVVKNVWRAFDTVFRMAKAKAMAPRRPAIKVLKNINYFLFHPVR